MKSNREKIAPGLRVGVLTTEEALPGVRLLGMGKAVIVPPPAESMVLTGVFRSAAAELGYHNL